MKIGELAQRTGLSRDTIRHYERNGLIASRASPEATNTYRDYPEDLVSRLGFVQNARDAGMSVADIRAMIDALGGSCAPEDARPVLQAKLRELEASAAQISQVIAFLKMQLDRL